MSNHCFNGLIGHKVVIHSCRSRYIVVICDICPSYIQAIEVGRGSTKIFNLDRIDYIEDLGC